MNQKKTPKSREEINQSMRAALNNRLSQLNDVDLKTKEIEMGGGTRIYIDELQEIKPDEEVLKLVNTPGKRTPGRGQVFTLYMMAQIKHHYVRLGYNMYTISKKFGISRTTLKSWRDRGKWSQEREEYANKLDNNLETQMKDITIRHQEVQKQQEAQYEEIVNDTMDLYRSATDLKDKKVALEMLVKANAGLRLAISLPDKITVTTTIKKDYKQIQNKLKDIVTSARLLPNEDDYTPYKEVDSLDMDSFGEDDIIDEVEEEEVINDTE